MQIYDDIASWIEDPEAPLPSGADGVPKTAIKTSNTPAKPKAN